MKTGNKVMAMVFFTSILLGSCKAYRNVENLQPGVSKEVQKGPFVQESLAKLIEGDKIFIESINGDEFYLYYKQVNGKNLNGTLIKKNRNRIEGNQRIEIPIVEIEKLYVLRNSAGATTVAVIFGSFAAAAGIFLLVFAIGGGLDLGF